MNLFLILAQTGRQVSDLDQTQVDYGSRYVLQFFDTIWQQSTALSWEQAVVAIAFGVVPLMYGWRIYKLLTVICLGLLGLYLGMWVGFQFNNALPGAIVGAVLFTVIALPLMRWAVCILGAVAGGVITAGIWHAVGLPEQFIWAGALVGVISGGLISFVVFKVSVMLFTGFAGTSLIILGVFSLIYHYETSFEYPPTTHLNHLYYNNPWFLPLLLIGGTFLGIILQLRFLKDSKDWSV